MEPISVKKDANLDINSGIIKQTDEKRYIYHHNFDMKYEELSPIIKNFQMVSQLIKFIKDHHISDLIFINGSNSYSIDSRFYFNYRTIIDFYCKVIGFTETTSYTTIKYHIYKTRPISKNFCVDISLFKDDENENSSKLKIEIILSKGIIISDKILNVIYTEFDYNFLYLSQAIKSQKQNSFFINSAILKNEFTILSKIIQNVKLIEYIINGNLQKINNKKSDNINADNDKYIHLNDYYEVNLNNKKYESKNKNIFKINSLKSRKDKISIEIKISSQNEQEKELENNNLEHNNNNNIVVQLNKLTNNSTYILFKVIWDFGLPEYIILLIQKIVKKSFNKIEKLCQIANDNYNS
jgi:hypothetical protein